MLVLLRRYSRLAVVFKNQQKRGCFKPYINLSPKTLILLLTLMLVQSLRLAAQQLSMKMSEVRFVSVFTVGSQLMKYGARSFSRTNFVFKFKTTLQVLQQERPRLGTDIIDGVDHGHDYGWAMDALFSDRTRPWNSRWSGHGCFLLRTE